MNGRLNLTVAHPFHLVVHVWLKWKNSIDASGEVIIVFLLLHMSYHGVVSSIPALCNNFRCLAPYLIHNFTNWFVFAHQ